MTEREIARGAARRLAILQYAEEVTEVDAGLAGTQADDDPLSALPGAGGASPDPQTERLSAIIDRLNERHALNLTITDALLFEQFKGDERG